MYEPSWLTRSTIAPAPVRCLHQCDPVGRGGLSQRQGVTAQWFTDFPDLLEYIEQGVQNDFNVDGTPMYYDFRFGNLCNLKCRTCSPTYSSSNGGYFNFNGVNNDIDFTSVTQVPIGNENYTISVWFSGDSTPFGDGLIGWGNYGNSNEVNALRMAGTFQLLNYWWANDLYAPFDYSANTWYNAVMTYTPGAITLYVNGVSQGTLNTSRAGPPSPLFYAFGYPGSAPIYLGGCSSVLMAIILSRFFILGIYRMHSIVTAKKAKHTRFVFASDG